MLTFMMEKNLRLVLETAKGGGMDDAITVALKLGPGRASVAPVKPAPAPGWIGCIRGSLAHGWVMAFSFTLPSPILSALTTVALHMSDIDLQNSPVTLSDRAARRISRILAKEQAGTVLRISVSGGGCSGFQYEYHLVQEDAAPDDLVLARDSAKVLIDQLSLEFMAGAEIDYVDDLIGQSFQIRNPNAVASCGCGTSFAVA